MKRWNAVAVGVAVVVAILVASQPLYVVGLTVFDYGETPEAPYATMQTKDASRFPADDPERLSALTAHAARPPDSGLNYSTVVRVPEDDWQAAIAASSLRVSEDAVVLYGDATAPPRSAGDGPNATASANASAPANVTTVTVGGESPAATAAAIATRGNGTDEVSPNNVVIVGANRSQWAMPAAAWSAYSGDPILFATEDGVPQATQRAIEELNASHAYVLAPPGVVGGDALDDLDVDWTRVSGDTPQTHAVRVAQYRDETRDFGWGIDGREHLGYYNFVLVNPERPAHAAAASNLQWGKSGPILLVEDDGGLPPVTESYAWSTQPAWYETPAEGPFNHLFVMGTLDDVSWITQGRLDYAVEITQYRHQGAGLSPLEAVAAVWFAFSLLGASFVFAHSRRRLPEMNDWTKLSWPLFTLVLGPVGLGLYWIAHRGRPVVETEMGQRVVRPYWLRAATATATGVGFAGSTMIATAFVLTYFGLPMVVLDGPLFWLGNAMTLLIGIVYVVAFLVSLFVFHVPMIVDNRGEDLSGALRLGALAVAVSMTSVSIGMMGGMWLLMMVELPMMPGDDNLLWFGIMSVSTLVGFLIAWPVNGLLTRRNVKPGGML